MKHDEHHQSGESDQQAADMKARLNEAATSFGRTTDDLRALLKIVLEPPGSPAQPANAKAFGRKIEAVGTALEELAEAYGEFIDHEPD